MQSHNVDIVIIGGGIIGSSILHELCQRGRKNIALIDCGKNTLSATAHSGGMFRVFHENTAHIDLALNNLRLIERYHRKGVITEKINENGCLYFFDKNRYQGYERNLNIMRLANYPFEVLTPETGGRKFPQYDWRDSWAIYEPLAGQLTPKILLRDLFEASRRLGAHIVDDKEVTRICPYRNYFKICGDNLSISSKILILAGGTRMLPRLQDLGICLPFTTKLITTFIAKKTQSCIQLPNYFDRESLRFACLGYANEMILSHKTSQRMRQKIWGDDLELKSAHDIYSANRLGYLGYVPGYPGLLLATGWGGTAFKFSLEVGRRVADLLVGGYE